MSKKILEMKRRCTVTEKVEEGNLSERGVLYIGDEDTV